MGLFSDRVRQALQQESHSLLGADLRINSIRPIPQDYRDAAIQRGLRVVNTASFPSMVSTATENLLSEIQALEEGYPLRGKIQIADASDDGSLDLNDPLPTLGHAAKSIPAPGTLWADDRLLRRMSAKLGDEINIGSLHLRLAARVIKDVDQSISFASVAPRVQINLADLAATGLVQEGSRINYRLLVAGDNKQIESFRNWIIPQIKAGEKLEEIHRPSCPAASRAARNDATRTDAARRSFPPGGVASGEPLRGPREPS